MNASATVVLLLLDVQMPGSDGYEVCREVRSWDAGAHLPIVMMTARGDQESIEHAYGAGATDFVAKPMNGVMSTASKLVFTGSPAGHFYALDGETGEVLWRIQLGGQGLGGLGGAAAVYTAPISFMSGGRQMVTISAGNALFTFALDSE